MAGCCGKGSKYPGVLAQAKSFSFTMAQAIAHAARTGNFTAPPDKVRERLEICAKCDRKSGIRCRECGCYIELKAAVLIAKCNLGKWPEIPPQPKS